MTNALEHRCGRITCTNPAAVRVCIRVERAAPGMPLFEGETGIVLCPMHQQTIRIVDVVTPARIANMDAQFLEAGHVPPNWTLATLYFEPVIFP